MGKLSDNSKGLSNFSLLKLSFYVLDLKYDLLTLAGVLFLIDDSESTCIDSEF